MVPLHNCRSGKGPHAGVNSRTDDILSIELRCVLDGTGTRLLSAIDAQGFLQFHLKVSRCCRRVLWGGSEIARVASSVRPSRDPNTDTEACSSRPRLLETL